VVDDPAMAAGGIDTAWLARWLEQRPGRGLELGVIHG
jgi:hypothetical protein